jgi:hypothetical protein
VVTGIGNIREIDGVDIICLHYMRLALVLFEH